MEVTNPSFDEEMKLLDMDTIPQHIAIIMDGNRRWAKENNHFSLKGHHYGADNLDNILSASVKIGVKYLTVYAFSTENWERPKEEVKGLMLLFERYLKKHTTRFLKEGIRFNIIGDISKCPKSLVKAIEKTQRLTKDCQKINLILAINYGARNEISRAISKIIKDYDNNKILLSDITENIVGNYLDTASCPNPDLLIRTGGERRLSNFLMWQLSYSEFYFTKTYWPDFSIMHLLEAIKEYQKRERRFGGK